MSNVYSLDDLRSDLDKKFAPVEIDGVVLRNVMRLGKTDRAAVVAAMDKLRSDDKEADQVDTALESIGEILTLTAENSAKGAALVKKIGDDVALGMKVLELWMAATQPGEAQNSPV